MSISGAMNKSSYLFERQADVVFRERGHARVRTRDVIEFGKLHAALKRRVLMEAMQHRGHPPGEALRLPHAFEADVGITFEQSRRARRVKLAERAREHAHVRGREVEPLGPGG